MKEHDLDLFLSKCITHVFKSNPALPLLSHEINFILIYYQCILIPSVTIDALRMSVMCVNLEKLMCLI